MLHIHLSTTCNKIGQDLIKQTILSIGQPILGHICGLENIQGSYPFSETNFQDFSRTSPGLRLIFQGL